MSALRADVGRLRRRRPCGGCSGSGCCGPGDNRVGHCGRCAAEWCGKGHDSFCPDQLHRCRE